MDGNSQLSIYAKLEIDKMQSINNIQKAVKEVGEKTTVQVNGINFDMQKVAKDFNKVLSTAFHVNKDNILTGYTSTLKNELGEILTLQSKFDESGNAYIASAKVVNKELETQKIRYEEIRKLYEKLGGLEAESVSASKKKQENLAKQVEETKKAIKTEEKALKKDGLTNSSLQNSVIEKQKLANTKLIAQEEEKLNKRRESSYNKLTKSLELIHKYNMQSVTANQQDLAVLERKKAVATSMRNSAQGTINRGGLSDDKLNEQIAQLKEIQALELKAAQQKAEQKTLNAELIELDNRRLATKKQLETIKNDDNAKAVLEKQLEEQSLAVFQKRAQLEEKGLLTQQTENALLQKQLDLENQIEVAKAKQLTASQKEQAEIEKLIARTQKNMGVDIKNSLNKNSKYITTEDLVAVEKFQQKLKQLNGTSLSGVKDQVANLKLEWKEINSNIQANKLKQTSTAVGELGQSFKNLATYVSGAMVIRKLWNELRTGITHIKEVDQAFTNMSMTMESLTKNQFNTMLDKVNTMSKEMGAVSSDVLKIAQTFANDSTSIEAVMAKLAPSTALMNISGMQATEVTKSIMSIANSYQMLDAEGRNAAEVTEYLGDVLSKVSANMDMDFQDGLQGLVSGIGVAGSTMRAAGVDMEWFVGQLGNAMVATGQSADKLGRGMRTITARVMQQKQALEELGESTEGIELEFAKGEKALKQLGITIRDDATGTLKSFSSIMDELGGKWKGLSDSTKYFIAEQLAGKNQMDIFIGMMDSYDSAMKLVNEAYDSQGTLMEMNGKYANSLEGKLNSLTSAQQELYQTFVNTDGFKAMIDGLTGITSGVTKVVDVFGSLPVIISTATLAFTTFNKSGRLVSQSLLDLAGKYSPVISNTLKLRNEQKLLIDTTKLNIATIKDEIAQKKLQGVSTANLVTKLEVENATLKKTQLQLVATTAKTVALQAAMSMGLSIAISAVVGGLSTLMSSLKKTDVDMDAVASSVKSLTEAMNFDESGLLSEYERLTKLSQEEGKTTKEIAYYNEELVKVKNELLGIDDKYASILNDETISLETQLNLMKAQRELRLKEQATEINDTLGSDNKYNKYSQQLEDSLKADYDLITRYQQMIDEAIANKSGVVVDAKTGVERSFEEATQILEEAKQRFQDTFVEGMERNSALEAIQEVSVGLGKELVGLTEGYGILFNAIQSGAESVSGAIAGGSGEGIQTVAEKVTALTTTFEALSNEQLKYADTISDIRATIQECGNDAEAQAEIVRNFLGTFPQYEGVVESVTDVLGVLGDKATIELGKAQAQAKNFLETMQDLENYTPDVAEQLLEAYPELAGHIQDTAYVQEFLNDKIAEMDGLYGMVMSQVDVHRTAQEEMLANDAEFWNQKMKNSENFLQYQNTLESKLIQMGADSLGIQYDDFASYIESKGGLRDVDYTNATTLAEAENMTEAQKLISMLQNYAMYVDEKDGYRGTDSKLIADFLNWQGTTEVQTVEELKQVWAAFYNAKKAALQKEISELTKFDETLHAYGEYDTSAYQASIQLQKLNNMNKQIMNATNLFSEVKTSYKGVGATYKGSGLGSSGLNTSPSSGSGSNSSGSAEQVVEDLELVIDRYYELNDALDDVNNALEMNRQLQSSVSDRKTAIKLMEEEISLLKEKEQATKNLQAEQRKEMNELKSTLSSAGFNFNKDGDITNYSSRLKAMQDYANSLSGEAKEAQIAYVNSIVDIIDSYTTLANDTIPSTELALEQLKQEIIDTNKAHEETLKLIDLLGDRYYEINSLIAQVDAKIAINQAKQNTASASERVELMKEEIELMKDKQKLLLQQKDEVAKEAQELAKKIAQQGVEFNADGTIKNYSALMKKLTDAANNLVNDAQDEAVENAEELIDLIEQYDDLIMNTLPDLVVEWEEYAKAIKDAEKDMAQQITDVQKNITSAIENELTKRTEKVKTELQKQKDLYNAQYEQEDWDRSLATEQRKLDEIQQQINDLSRDTSLAGQLKLQQLREEFEAQQQVIDDMIRDKEKENGNARFDEEMEKLDQELEDALDPQNIADLVNKALVDGFVTIGDEVIALDTLMTDWLNETGDGLYAIGNSLKSELIDNLQTAKTLMESMGLIDVNSKLDGTSTTGLEALASAQANQSRLIQSMNALQSESDKTIAIQLDNLINIQGNVTEDVLPKIEAMIDSAKTEVFDNIAKQITSR